ncbi:N-acetyltransferase [bacterium]|nr:N-acetyltransferase [bacterium]
MFSTKRHEDLQQFTNEPLDDPQIIGVCALNIIWEDLAEIRSLAVNEAHQRKGIGTNLVNACIKEASDLGVKKVFCLTYRKDFFSLLGFNEIDKSQLPHKIWADCLKCSKFPDCSEIAMIYEIQPPLK